MFFGKHHFFAGWTKISTCLQLWWTMVNNGERLEKWVIVSCCFIIFFEMDRNHRMKRHCCRTCSTCNSFATLPSRNLNSANLWVDFRDMIPQNVRPYKIWIEWYLEYLQTFWDVQMGIWSTLSFPKLHPKSELPELLQLRVAPQNQNLGDGSMTTWGHHGSISQVWK